MIFKPTKLIGAFVLELEIRTDHRGGFARTYCAKEFMKQGLNPCVSQMNMSINPRKGTLRGLHHQLPPASEAKLVRCVKGTIFVAIVDLRTESPTYLDHFGMRLDTVERVALYVPERFAHGYLTLENDTEVVYNASSPYTPECERGIRYDDPLFGIEWPVSIESISEKDLSWPPYTQG